MTEGMVLTLEMQTALTDYPLVAYTMTATVEYTCPVEASIEMIG